MLTKIYVEYAVVNLCNFFLTLYVLLAASLAIDRVTF